MTSKKICVLDQNAVGPGLLVGDGNLTISTIATLPTLAQSVHGDVVAANGTFYFECYVWSTSRVSLAGKVRIGVVDVDAATSTTLIAPGNQAAGAGYGFDLGSASVYSNSIPDSGSLGVVPLPTDERNTIGVLLVLSPSAATLSFTVNGSYVWQKSLTVGKSWIPAFTISGDIGDVRLKVNFGQDLFDNPVDRSGWNIQTPGLDRMYLSIVQEGFLSGAADSPANQLFAPVMLNPAQFSWKREVKPWPYREGAAASAPIPSAFASIDLDNSRGDFNALLRSDVKGSTMILQQPALAPAPASGSGTIAGAVTLLTACIDSVSAPSINVVRVNLKDNLARLDIPMPCRRIPLYADSSSAGLMMPFGIGAQRLFTPPLVDAPNRIYQLGDEAFSNIQVVRDRGAPLDQLTQYSPVGNGQQIQLNQDAQGKVSIDGSTLGQQEPASGAIDVLAGIGEFETWTAGVPNGWSKPASPPVVVANGSIALVTGYGTGNSLSITSRVPYAPQAANPYYFGYPLKTTANYLLPGRTYNISFQLQACLGNSVSAGYGLALLTGLVRDARYWITDFAHPLNFPQVGVNGNVTYSYQYTVPATFPSALPIYICVVSRANGGVPSTPQEAAVVVIDNLHVQLLGQYNATPMIGASLNNFMGALFNTRCGEPGIFSAPDCNSIDVASSYATGSRYQLGRRWNDQPNVMDAMQEWLDNYCAVAFTDETNKVRVRRFIAPELGTPVALFNSSNIDLTNAENFSLVPDQIPGLTNQIGARRNCDPMVDSDFVSDDIVIPRGQREQFKRISQFPLTSAVTLAAEYQFALGQFRFESLFDDPAQAIAELNRVMAIWKPQIDASGNVTTKRSRVTFKANYSDLVLGAGPSVAPQSLYPLDCITIDLPSKGLNAVPATIMSIQVFPFSRRCEIEAML